MNLHTRFTFNPVGQGLFYDGQIGGFRFVYDCGSKWKKYVAKSISDYKLNIGTSELSLLIISHFDEDHISGLDDLLSNLPVDFAVLPYVSPLERLLLAVANDGLDPWLYDFWADPVSYLIESKGVRTVIIMGGGAGNGPERGSETDSGIDEGFLPPKIDLESFQMPDDVQVTKRIESEEPKLKPLLGNRLFVKNHNGYLKIAKLWKFRFFVLAPTDGRLADFAKCVDNQLALFPASSYWEGIKAIIKDSKQRNGLKACYENLFKKKQAMNLTSLVAHHSPTRRKHQKNRLVTVTDPPQIWLKTRTEASKPRGTFGHFLTGDTVLNVAWDEMSVHFKDEFAKTSGVLIPHHGAKDNWDHRILQMTRPHPMWFVSAGIGNSYGHPSREVIDQIVQRDEEVFWSNQYSQVFESMDYDPV